MTYDRIVNEGDGIFKIEGLEFMASTETEFYIIFNVWGVESSFKNDDTKIEVRRKMDILS